jgi:hypothetical protein
VDSFRFRIIAEKPIQIKSSPALRPTAGFLPETPFMGLVISAAARWTIRWVSVPPISRVVGSAGGLDLLVVAEIAGVRWARGLSVADYVATLTPVSAAVFLFMFGLSAVMHALVARRR